MAAAFSSQVAILGFIVFVAVCVAYLRRIRQWSSVSRLPAPPGAEFLWGHERSIITQVAGKAFKAWIQDHGLCFRIKAALWAPDVVILSDPLGVTHLLQKKVYDYPHSPVVRPRVGRLLGKGLGWIEGEQEHKRMKQLINPSFSAESLKAMTTEVRDAASRVLNDFIDSVQLEGGSKQWFDIMEVTAKATLNVIGRVGFRLDFEGGDNADARQILDARKAGVRPSVSYLSYLVLMLLRRFPTLNNLPLPVLRLQSSARDVIHRGVAPELLKRKHILGSEEKKEEKNLLNRLLNAESEGRMSQSELYEQISTFIIAGHETTTLTLGYSIWELARRPKIQERLREELMAFPGEPTYDDYSSRLPYLDAVLKETLRLYPGLPYMERVATKADVIPLGHDIMLSDGQCVKELVVQPGQTIVIPILSMHRLDSVWKDADTFRPERWLEDLPPREQLYSGWANTLAFSDGPRRCIGLRLAIFQYKVIMTTLITRCRFEDTGAKLLLKISSSLQPWVVGQTGKGPQIPVDVHLL